MLTLVVAASLLLGVAACRDATAPAPTLSIAAVSALQQQATVNQFVSSSPTVRVTDAAGTPAAGVTVVFTAGSAVPVTATTASDGTASFHWRLATTSGTQVVATAISSGHSPVTGPWFTAIALPDTLAAIRAVSVTSQVGVAQENPPALPVVLAVDRFDNPKPGVAVTFAMAAGDSAVVTTDTTGQAAPPAWKLRATVATDTLVARAGGFGPVYFTARVVPPFTATTVVVGAAHSCALTPGGDVYCWGENALGQANPASFSASVALPVRVALPAKLVSLSGFNGHTCGISNESPPEAYCWGLNSDGELGLPTTTVATAPAKAPVADGLALVTTGAKHTCGLTPAGLAYCWGDDTFGQLGTADTLSCTYFFLARTCLGPRRVATDSRFLALVSGAWHTCGLTSAGQWDCWGLDDLGQLGFAAAEACTEFVPSIDDDGPVPCGLAPQTAPGWSVFTSVAGGLAETCGLTAAGSVSCYGIGPGTVSFASFMRLSPDGDCGLTTDGVAECWSSTFDAPRASFSTPVPIGTGRTFATLSAALGTPYEPPADVYQAPGFLPHRCGVLANTGAVVCWGGNAFGELGNGTTIPSTVPQPVVLP